MAESNFLTEVIIKRWHLLELIFFLLILFGLLICFDDLIRAYSTKGMSHYAVYRTLIKSNLVSKSDNLSSNNSPGDPPLDVTGVYRGGRICNGPIEGCETIAYYVRQIGNTVWWVSMGSDGRWFTDIFHGVFSNIDNTSIDGNYIDVPRGQDALNGTLRLKVNSNSSGVSSLEIVNVSGNPEFVAYDPSGNRVLTLTRTIIPPNPDNSNPELEFGGFAKEIAPSVWYGGQNGNTYYMQRIGDTIWWVGMSNDDGKTFTNIFQGTINAKHIVSGNWIDVPRGKNSGSGTLRLVLSLDSAGEPIWLNKISESGDPFYDSNWVRVGPIIGLRGIPSYTYITDPCLTDWELNGLKQLVSPIDGRIAAVDKKYVAGYDTGRGYMVGMNNLLGAPTSNYTSWDPYYLFSHWRAFPPMSRDYQDGTIISRYEPEFETWCAFSIHDAIWKKWDGLNRQFTTGVPSYDQGPTSDHGIIGGGGGGEYIPFNWGGLHIDSIIVSTNGTGAHELHGPIMDKWNELNTLGILIGYPVTDTTTRYDINGQVSGMFAHFQYGTILWSPTAGVHVVLGQINENENDESFG